MGDNTSEKYMPRIQVEFMGKAPSHLNTVIVGGEIRLIMKFPKMQQEIINDTYKNAYGIIFHLPKLKHKLKNSKTKGKT